MRNNVRWLHKLIIGVLHAPGTQSSLWAQTSAGGGDHPNPKFPIWAESETNPGSQ